MVKKLYLSPICPHKDLKCLEGEFLPNKPLDNFVNYDCDIYANENGKRKLIAKFRQNIINPDLADLAIDSFKKEAKKSSGKRGIASGQIDIKKLSKNVKKIVNPNSITSKVIWKDGRMSKYYLANPVNSIIAGYFDQPLLSKKSEILKKGLSPCRTTYFTEKKQKEWHQVLPLVKRVNTIYRTLLPSKFSAQKKLCKKIPQYCIDNTIFTTLTINYNWQTACHVDKGDLTEGYSCITVSEEGTWTGGYLSIPRFALTFDIRHGDILIFNPHEYHCNSKIIPKTKEYTRLSVVYYFREGLLKC